MWEGGGGGGGGGGGVDVARFKVGFSRLFHKVSSVQCHLVPFLWRVADSWAQSMPGPGWPERRIVQYNDKIQRQNGFYGIGIQRQNGFYGWKLFHHALVRVLPKVR